MIKSLKHLCGNYWLHSSTFLLVVTLFSTASFSQRSDQFELPSNYWELMGTCVESEQFAFLKDDVFRSRTDDYNNLIYYDNDQIIEFYFRPSTRHLYQIRVDLDLYSGQEVLRVKKGMSKRRLKKLLDPVDVLNYGTGSFYLGERYSVIAAFDGWPKRKLYSVTIVYEGEYYPDKDMDGVADSMDRCPDLIGTLSKNGCPEAEDTTYFKALKDEYCRIMDTFMKVYSFKSMPVFPTEGIRTPSYLLTPNRIYNPGIEVTVFDQVLLVESFELESDTSRSLHVVSKPMNKLQAEELFKWFDKNSYHCWVVKDVFGEAVKSKLYYNSSQFIGSNAILNQTWKTVDDTEADTFLFVAIINIHKMKLPVPAEK